MIGGDVRLIPTSSITSQGQIQLFVKGGLLIWIQQFQIYFSIKSSSFFLSFSFLSFLREGSNPWNPPWIRPCIITNFYRPGYARWDDNLPPNAANVLYRVFSPTYNPHIHAMFLQALTISALHHTPASAAGISLQCLIGTKSPDLLPMTNIYLPDIANTQSAETAAQHHHIAES